VNTPLTPGDTSLVLQLGHRSARGASSSESPTSWTCQRGSYPKFANSAESRRSAIPSSRTVQSHEDQLSKAIRDRRERNLLQALANELIKSGRVAYIHDEVELAQYLSTELAV
jgi:hypothetical protein